MKKVKSVIWAIGEVVLITLMLIALIDLRVSHECVRCFNTPDEVPARKLAVVLGTAKYRVSGGVNLYYRHRLEAAATLYQSGKVEFLLISGDNSVKEYDEPTTIKRDLVKMGVPAERIFLDYAGFRTFDSMVRCKEVFGETNVIVVSQRFHNERALYIARHIGVDAIGFNARDVDASYGLKTNLREKFARTRMWLDVHILNTQPKFLGPRIDIALPQEEVEIEDVAAGAAEG
ncbi:MAG: vancomycin high temperature exclusion protein [Cryomorphaceae bacterium]|nr:MAG: vancomycin high temperature exclusion protein [Cryomorphaceae bacterium]